MSLRRLPFALLLANLLAHGAARAEEKCRIGDTDCEEKAQELNAEPEDERGEPRVINVSGLVPLKEVNKRPYSGIWFADFRYHEWELGLTVLSLHVDGKVSAQFNDGTGVMPVTEEVSGSNSFAGIVGSYYFPLIGYSPNASLGLAPELHAMLGGFEYSGSTSSALSDLSETKIGTALVVPIYLMARIGGHASRYGDWPFSLGAGVGMGFVSFSEGEPVVDSSSFAQPLLKFEAAYRAFKAGFSTGLGYHDNFKSPNDAIRLAYRAEMITLTFVFQPDPED